VEVSDQSHKTTQLARAFVGRSFAIYRHTYM
jgi:hypothetical protein